jgi:hypothetical protein
MLCLSTLCPGAIKVCTDVIQLHQRRILAHPRDEPQRKLVLSLNPVATHLFTGIANTAKIEYYGQIVVL